MLTLFDSVCRSVDDDSLVMAIASVLSGIAVLLFIMGFITNPLLFFVSLPFAGTAYLMWYHASGRLAERIRRAEASGRHPNDRQNEFGAGLFGANGFTRERVRSNRGRARRSARGARANSTGWDRADNASRTDGLSRSEAYTILGVSPDASAETVRAAYREKAIETHPDTDGGDKERFKRVNRAYDLLTDRS